jgi:adenosylmethionine-8-amino-7-oxononanoate aminotransferase
MVFFAFRQNNGRLWKNRYEGVMPEIFTAAKGISSAVVPLSTTACNEGTVAYFDNKTLGWYSTYQAHPVALAAACETVKFRIQNDIVGHVASMAPLFEEQMNLLSNIHPCISNIKLLDY